MIIGFRGAIAAGKTTAANYLHEKFGFSTLSFGDPLRAVVTRITPDGLIDKVRDRELMQFIATDYYRKINPNHWTEQFIEVANTRTCAGLDVVNDDARFDNEFAAIKADGILVWIESSNTALRERTILRDGAATKGIAGHASEAHLDKGLYDPRNDIVIYNDGTQIEFFDLLNTLIKKIEINRIHPPH